MLGVCSGENIQMFTSQMTLISETYVWCNLQGPKEYSFTLAAKTWNLNSCTPQDRDKPAFTKTHDISGFGNLRHFHGEFHNNWITTSNEIFSTAADPSVFGFSRAAVATTGRRPKLWQILMILFWLNRLIYSWKWSMAALKGNYYWRDTFLASMIMGGRVNQLHTWNMALNSQAFLAKSGSIKMILKKSALERVHTWILILRIDGRSIM